MAVPYDETLPKTAALVRDILERIADKWTLLVIDAFDGEHELRFSRLQQRVGGVSQKMLAKTLRQLERDGLVTRRVHATVPSRVDYKLTQRGEELGEATCAIWLWVDAHADAMRRSRRTVSCMLPLSLPSHRRHSPGVRSQRHYVRWALL